MSAQLDFAMVPEQTWKAGRLGSAAAWLSAVCCIPYFVLKVLWTIDIPLGITDESLFDDSGWAAANALMAVVQLAGFLLVLALTQGWGIKLPTWLLLFPVWVGTGLLFQVVVGAVLFGLFSASAESSSGAAEPIEPWVFVVVYAGFAGQGFALAIAFACYVRNRWRRLLGERSGDVVARWTARATSRAGTHFTGLAEAVAALAVAVALPFSYWVAGGAFGLPGEETDPSSAVQASRLVGALVAGAGLLGLAGRWGRQTRFWLPAALTWLGSGALAAFDGFNLTINRLFVLFGADVSGPAWSWLDTVLVIKVLIGLLAASVGALAVAVANRDGNEKATRAPLAAIS
jgi:hypothetical protein